MSQNYSSTPFEQSRWETLQLLSLYHYDYSSRRSATLCLILLLALASSNVARESVDQSNDNTIDEQCFFQYAKHIDAQYPDWYVDIEEGCTAKCNGCIFAPTVMFRKWLFEYSSFWLMHTHARCSLRMQISNRIKGGPTKIDCQNGRCTNYTTDILVCGDEIEEASESFGSYQTLLDGSNIVHSLHGYEGINKAEPITIPKNCILNCSGCRRHVNANARKKNIRGSKNDKISI